MRKVAILIAVEHYSDKRISQVTYAETDARELGAVLTEHGFDATDQALLIDALATKASIESRVRKTLQVLRADDTLYVFYAGHGFAKNGNNYITCHDTNLDDLEDTSVPVAWLFTQFNQSACKRVALFLDSCESGMLASTDIRGIYTDLTEDELRQFFEIAEHRVCFAACKPGEKSYPSNTLKHGIWTYHLIQALSALAPMALEKGHLISSSSLQNHLSAEVPRTLRTTYTGTHVQTPWFYGAQSSDFLVGDAAPLLAKRKSTANPTAQQLLRIRLYEEHGLPVRRLSGFQKHHRVPDRVNSATEAFVGKISANEINEDLDRVHEKLRVAFGFKRKDLRTEQSEFGGSIITPYFDYDVTVTLNPADPSEVIWCRQVLNIREPDQVLSSEFEQVFPAVFDTLEFETERKIDISGLVDQIEALDDDRLAVNFDKDLTWCAITVGGLDVTVRVTPSTFSIEQDSGCAPRLLIDGFFQAQKHLVNTHQLKELPFVGGTKGK